MRAAGFCILTSAVLGAPPHLAAQRAHITGVASYGGAALLARGSPVEWRTDPALSLGLGVGIATSRSLILSLAYYSTKSQTASFGPSRTAATTSRALLSIELVPVAGEPLVTPYAGVSLGITQVSFPRMDSVSAGLRYSATMPSVGAAFGARAALNRVTSFTFATNAIASRYSSTALASADSVRRAAGGAPLHHRIHVALSIDIGVRILFALPEIAPAW